MILKHVKRKYKRQVSSSIQFCTQNNPTKLDNTILRFHVSQSQHQKALHLYKHMLSNNNVDKYTFTFALKACKATLNLQDGRSIHHEVKSRGLEHDVFIATALIHMYFKLNQLRDAKNVFDKMPVRARDVAVWNAMIGGLGKSVSIRDALRCFSDMRGYGFEVNSVTVLSLLVGVSERERERDARLCKGIHGFCVRKGFCGVVLSNGLVDVYGKCGDVDSARGVFDGMVERDGVSFGTMVAGYVRNGFFVQGLEVFDLMMGCESVGVNKVGLVSALGAASEIRDLERGREIHECVVRQGFYSDVAVATSVLSMYAKCGDIEEAKRLFRGIPEKDLVAWSALIAALVQSGYPEEALGIVRDMEGGNVKPNMVTLMSVIAACADLWALRLGKSVHCCAIKADIDSNVSIATTLVSMYAKCEHCASAQIVFNMMPWKDVVTWNALINGYSQIGDPYSTIKMFLELLLSDVDPDSGTVMGVVSACILLNDQDQGSCIHGQIIKRGFKSDSRLRNSLIDMYAKCGSIPSARFLFDESGFMKDEVSWNVMIAGYMQNGHAREAISTFIQMTIENFRPNLVTYITVIPTLAFLASLKEGMSLHAHVIKTGYFSSTLIGNSLIDMYSKCGQLHYAGKCFGEVDNKSTVSWNTMLGGYAMHGHGDSAVSFFLLMQNNLVQIDSVSFLSVLSACRHAGLVIEGKNIFKAMREKYNIVPNMEHYACMVDLLGCAGLFDEVLCLIEEMPMEPDAGVWGALLGACRMHSNVTLGEVAVDHLAKLEPQNAANYVVLSNLYAQSGRWGDAGNVRSKTNVTGSKKIPGCSWFEEKKLGICISER